VVNINRIRTVLTGVGGSPWYSNLYFDPSLGVGANAFIEAVYNFWSACSPYLASSTHYTIQGDVPTIDSATGNILSLEQLTGGDGGGTGNSSVAPPVLQALLETRTGTFQGGREIRGRINVPGLTSTVLASDGTLTSEAGEGFASAAEALGNGAAGGDPHLVVWSRKTGLCPAVSVITVQDKLAVLRSRRD
jgi:hypothetical protein